MDIKTPVSKLQELIAKSGGFLPKYELIKISGPSHNPTFEYSVRTNSIIAIGCGKSKQEAKHNAAQNALKQLNEKGINGTILEAKNKEINIEIHLNNKCECNMQSPVSVLQEKMVKVGFSPVYDLIKMTGENHNPVFEYVVRVKNVIAFGQGRTKRDAKHNAAKNALLKLQNLEECTLNANITQLEVEKIVTKNLSDKRESSCNGSTLTPVSKLQSCFSCDDDLPEFKLTNVSGLLHDPIFEYTVKVKDIVVSGIGKTKKEAKQNAAKIALDKLKEKGLQPSFLENSINCEDDGIFGSDEDETLDSEETLPNLLDKLNITDSYENSITDSDVIHKRNELKGVSNDTNSVSIYEYHNSLKKLDPIVIENAKKLLHNDERDLQKKLKNIMEVLKFTYTIEVLPCQKSGSYGFTVKMKSIPPHVIADIGQSPDEAKQKVILKTFNFLDIMLR